MRHKLRVGDIELPGTIDAWFTERMGLAPDQTAGITQVRPATPDQVARGLCERACALYTELLRGCGLPCFDRGHVLAVRASGEEPDSFDVALRLPVIDHITEKFFADLYGDVQALLHGPLLSPPTEERAARLDATIKDGLLLPTKSWAPITVSVLQICRIAHDARIPFRHHGQGVLQFGWGRNARFLYHGSLDRDSAVGAALARDKQHCAQFLSTAGFPVPSHRLVASSEAALDAARALGWPVVVKPADRERSEGVTVGIRDETALGKAYALARGESERVLVERQIPGVCHRILVADGQIVYVVARYPKAVRGDGKNTVRKLIEDVNVERARDPVWKRLDPLPVDELAIESLAAIGLELDAVPAEDTIAVLRPLHGQAWGGVVKDVRAIIHPDNARLAIEVADAMGLKIAGIDLMSPDIAVAWHENGAAINEVNFRPEFAVAARTLDVTGLLSALTGGEGRVPIHLVTGSGDLLSRAHAQVQRSREAEKSCYLLAPNMAEDGTGQAIDLRVESLFERTLALLMRRDLDELVVVDPTGEFLRRGFPVDRFETVLAVHADHKQREALLRQIEARVATRFGKAVAAETAAAAQ